MAAGPTTGRARGALAAWWHDAAGIDPRTLTLLRVGLALVLLCDIASRATDLRAHYSDWGILPRWAVPVWLGRWAWGSPYLWRGEAWWAGVLLALTAVAAVALLLGRRSRLAALACFLLAAGLHARNPGIDHGGDNLLRVMLFWAIFLPLEAGWTPRAGLAASWPAPSAGVFAMRLQLCLVYWATGLGKWNAAWLERRDAVVVALSLDYITTPFGRLLLELPAVVLRAAAPLVVGFELLAPLLVWSPFLTARLRTAVVAAFVLFHLAFLAPAFVLGTFPWICAVAWTVFLPTWFWERTRFRTTAAAAARPRAPAATAPAGRGASPPATGARLGVAGEGILLIALAYLVVVAAATLWPARLPLPAWVETPAVVAGLRQDWGMFVVPPSDDGWWVMAGTLASGELRDVWRDGPLEARKPPSVAAVNGNSRWMKYLSQLDDRAYVHHRRLFAGYLCRRWNELHGGGETLTQVQLFMIRERTLPGGGVAAPLPILLWRQTCDTR